LHQRYPNKKIYLSGFSLGGNVILKYLGELGDRASKDLNIIGAVATSVPFDPLASQPKLDQGFSRAVYSENFLKTLKAKAELKILRFPGSFDIEAVRRCKTIGDFDQAFIAPVFGYLDKEDYYRKTGSKWWLSKIRVPTVCINALDDPFIEETALPTDRDTQGAPVRLIYHRHGGHCGFMAHTPPAAHGWLAEEMARALLHIHTEYEKYLKVNASYIFT
jgi:predicted alpha/beta-fold hydrolase